MPIVTQAEPEATELGIATDRVCQVIQKARQYDAKESDSDPDEGSNATDDGMTDVLEDKEDDPVRDELESFIRALDIDEQIALVALAWVGRGTYDKAGWKEALDTARTEHNSRTAEYLLGLPLLGDYLAEGLAAFGEDCSETEPQL